MEFQSLFSDLDLMDLPLHGGKWTWSNQREQPSFPRIDIFLISPYFLETMPNIIQKIVARTISDHFQIILVFDGIQWSLVLFQLDNK